MREKMRTHSEKKADGFWDVKQGEGGLTDVEFITQYLVLAHSHLHPNLIEHPDHWRQTEALAQSGLLSKKDGETLIECYRQFRAFVHARALQNANQLAPIGQFSDSRQRVRLLWQSIFNDSD